MLITFNAPHFVAHPSVFCNVDEIWAHVVIVSWPFLLSLWWHFQKWILIRSFSNMDLLLGHDMWFSACPCYTDCINGCADCGNPICFCSVSWKALTLNHYEIIFWFLWSEFSFKDGKNDDNFDSCFTNNSKSLGQCIIDCNNDSSCEVECVVTFKSEHKECPCQVVANKIKVYRET